MQKRFANQFDNQGFWQYEYWVIVNIFDYFNNQGCWQWECKELASVTGIGKPQLQIPLTAISLHPEHANMCQ